MNVRTEKGALPVSLAEAQAYVRIETGEEEALLAGLLRTATDVCERFTGQLLVERPFEEILSARSEWTRLAVRPVRAIEAVAAMASDGTTTPLPADQYAVDVDGMGTGWVRLFPTDASRLLVSGRAGMVGEAQDVPEPIRQGIVRLVAHMFAHRDGDDGAPPAAVTALWRPFRQVSL